MSEHVQDVPGRPEMPWGAWGEPRPLPAAVLDMLRQFLGLAAEPAPAVPVDSVTLAPGRLSDPALRALRDAAGPGGVHQDRAARLGHTGGKSTTDLLRRRAGDATGAPDAVVTPGSHDEVLAVLRAAQAHRLAVVPFGGGTSVTGGVEAAGVGSGAAGVGGGTSVTGGGGAAGGGLDAVIVLDLARMDRLISVDPVSLTATMEAGLRAPRAEELLAARGLTLGHLPQSFEHASIGGFAATRSAGQASAGYGRFDDMVIALRAATPRGTLDAGGRAPASAAGPDLRQVLLGSEGAFGVITEVTAAVRPAPEAVIDEAWQFADFEAGTTAMRALAQAGRPPATVARLSDPVETSVLGLTGGHAVPGCLAVLSFEGTAQAAADRQRDAAGILLACGGQPAGPQAVAGWRQGRFDAPYLRDALLAAGALAETLETATSWASLGALRAGVGDALSRALTGAGTPPVVMCHISHIYPAGASLYYTVVAAQAADPVGQWVAAKRAASAAIMDGGGTITHHHGVGMDHRDWMTREIGALGVDVLRAVKAALDPAGILNPGKLIPPGS
jgi:alkyldihydroxyacetonephosphate synthase